MAVEDAVAAAAGVSATGTAVTAIVAVGPAGIPGYEPFYLKFAQALGEPFGHAEVQLADRARVAGRDLGERAAPEHELHPASPPGPVRAEPAPR